MTDYQLQATDFLQATNTKFTATFKKHDHYFDDDKDTRDIFTCVLKNAKHRFRFTFGQSVRQSTGDGGNLPDAYDILTSLTKYEVGSFEDFCFDMCFDTDSRKAYKTYKAVLREWKNVQLLFTPEQIELLQEIN
jgi:hypothetical protein